jgi:hypothetical protein
VTISSGSKYRAEDRDVDCRGRHPLVKLAFEIGAPGFGHESLQSFAAIPAVLEIAADDCPPTRADCHDW